LAVTESAAVELDETLLAHDIGGIQERLLIELGKRLLKTVHGQTSAALAQHLRDAV